MRDAAALPTVCYHTCLLKFT